MKEDEGKLLNIGGHPAKHRDDINSGFNDYKISKDITSSLTDWFKGRGIPSLRDDLDLLLAKLNISSPEELLDKYGIER